MHKAGGRALPSSALDFLATIDAKERLPGGAGAFAILDEADRATLVRLLRSYNDRGLTAALERQARMFLISYREIDKHAGVLDAAERKRLDRILDETSVGRRGVNYWGCAAAALVLLLAAGLVIWGNVGSDRSGPPSAAAGRPVAAQQVPPGMTELQKLRQDFGPWRQLVPAGLSPKWPPMNNTPGYGPWAGIRR